MKMGPKCPWTSVALHVTNDILHYYRSSHSTSHSCKSGPSPISIAEQPGRKRYDEGYHIGGRRAERPRPTFLFGTRSCFLFFLLPQCTPSVRSVEFGYNTTYVCLSYLWMKLCHLTHSEQKHMLDSGSERIFFDYRSLDDYRSELRLICDLVSLF